MFINKNKTANIKGKNYRFTTTCKVDYTDVTQLKLQKKIKKEGDITLHYIDILAMYCRVLSPCFFLFLQFQLCDIRIVDLTRSCTPVVFAFYSQVITSQSISTT